MSNKEIFIKEIDTVLRETPDFLSLEALAYFESLKEVTEKEPFTENGAKILGWMQEHYNEYNNVMKSKVIAEGLFIGARSVSGAMRRLITDGYVTKIAGNPVCYSLTETGINCVIPAVVADET